MEEDLKDESCAYEESKHWSKVRPKNKTKLGDIPEE